MKYTLAEALEYSQKGDLESWLTAYLMDEGDNSDLAKGLKLQKRYYTPPVKTSLSPFKRNSGPEKEMKFIVTPESFEKNVCNIQKRFKDGWDMPPLLIQYSEDKFDLNDGNHRFEALKRSGIDEYYIIFWCSTKAEFDDLEQAIQSKSNGLARGPE